MESQKCTVSIRHRSGGVGPTGENCFPSEEMKKSIKYANYSTGDFLKTAWSLIIPLEPE